MNAPVDVRAVLDVRRHLGVKQSSRNANAAFLDWRDWCNYLPEADKASAALASLISEARHAEFLLRDMAQAGFGDPHQADGLRAALRGIGGAR